MYVLDDLKWMGRCMFVCLLVGLWRLVRHLIMIIMRGMRGKILVNGPKLAFTTHPISFKDVCLVREIKIGMVTYINKKTEL
jgi:hypothetical protein